MTVQITIVGLNQIGASIGLAVKAAQASITLIGCDSDTKLEQRTLKLGAIDKVVHNLSSAVDTADVIVLCLPADEVRKTIALIAPVLKEGAVVLETSALKSAAIRWGTGSFPNDRHILIFAPALNPEYLNEAGRGLDHAHADLFHNSVILIGSTEKTDPDAVKLAADLSVLLGAKPYFSDPVEAEGLIALIHHLPQLSAIALTRVMDSQPGWREARKVASRPLASAFTPLLDLDERNNYGQALLLNSENNVRIIDELIAELTDLRDLIASQNADGLKDAIVKAVSGRDAWLKTRFSQEWEASEGIEMPKSGGLLGKLFGLGGKTKESDQSVK